MKVCLIGSRNPYPAFDSVLSILRDVLGQKQAIELRITSWLSASPSLFKLFLYVFQDLLLCLKIVKCYKKEKINTILMFQNYYPLSCMSSKILNTKLLLFIGGSGFYWSYLEHASTMGKVFAYANLPIERICHKFADALITLSKNMVKMIGLEKYEYKASFALPRLDKEFFSQFRITKNYEQRGNIVGFVGLLCRRKGVLNFIQAIPLIANTKKDCKFLLVGRGPLLEIIRTEAQKLEIGESMKITGFVDNDNLIRHYNEMKLYVLPTYAEGVPSTIFEAVACGTPVLTTPVGGIPDVVEHCETGFLLRSNDPKHIAERITELLDDPELLQKVSANAYRYVRENFSEEKVLASWRRIFEELSLCQ